MPLRFFKEFAAKEKLEIVTSLCEAKTAKEPENKSARTIFVRAKEIFSYSSQE